MAGTVAVTGQSSRNRWDVYDPARSDLEQQIYDLTAQYPEKVVIPVGKMNWARDGYQRETSKSKVARLESEWSSLKVGVMLANLRPDGSYWGMDGGHRSEVMTRKFGRDFTADWWLYHYLSPEQESSVFHGVNANRGPVTALKKYYSNHLAGEEPSRTLISVLDSVGIGWDHQGPKEDNKLICWGSIDNIYRLGGVPLLEGTLRLVKDTWHGDRYSLNAEFVTGVFLLLRNHQKDAAWNSLHFTDKLKLVPSSAIIRQGREIRSGYSEYTPNASQAIYWALHRAYNKGKRTGKLSSCRVELARERLDRRRLTEINEVDGQVQVVITDLP